MATKAGVRAWRGVWMGWVAFLVLAALSYLTPVRLTVLKLAGRDYAVMRLEAASTSPSPGGSERPDLAARRAAWARDHARLSPFGFVRWADDLWPWLVGLGIALPVLGGFIGAQAGGRGRALATSANSLSSAAGGATTAVPGAATDRLTASRPKAASAAAVASSVTSTADVPTSLPTSGASRDQTAAPRPVAPLEPSTDAPTDVLATEAPTLPADPAAWSWNARPAPRAAPRPKPPPVISPNGGVEE